MSELSVAQAPVKVATPAQPAALQHKLAVGGANDPLEQEADRIAHQVLATPAHPGISGAPPRIQRYAWQATEGTDTAPASVGHVLTSPGRPLDPALRQDMGQRFGRDFSRVRVHSGTAAEQSAREVNAKAYTAGHNIVFGSGRFAPATYEGRRLIAHELTHVVQQSAESGVLSTKRAISEPGDAAEQEAEGVSGVVAQGKAIEHVPTAIASGSIQREPSGPEELAGAAKKWLGRKYSAGKEAVYKGLISGLRKFQKAAFDMLRAQASRLPASAQPALVTILNIWEEVFGVLITLLLAIVGIVVGFGEGIVGIVEGLVGLLWGIVKWFSYLILGFFDNGQKFEQYNKEIMAAASNIPDGLRALVRDWLDKFEKAPIDRGSLMIGELVGQIVAFIASFGVAAAKVGQVPKLVGEFTVVASRGGELALVAVPAAVPAQAAAAAGAVGLTSPALMQAGKGSDPIPDPKGGTNVPPESPPVKVEDFARGGAIESDHLGSMPEYSRPREHDFPGIDGWKGGREVTRDTTAGKMRIIYDADVLQIKSAGSAKPSTIRASVKKGVAGIEPNVFEKGGTRVVNPRSRRLDVLFEEGVLLDVNSETRALLTELTVNAGNSGVEVRWFRYALGRKIPIPIP